VGRKAADLGGIEGFARGESHRKPGCRKGDPAFLFLSAEKEALIDTSLEIKIYLRLGWTEDVCLKSNRKEKKDD
jgi:hypothetical protein